MQKSVMVIDDDEAILRMIDRMLSGTDYHCLTFNDAQEALDSLARQAVHLIITDIIMPGIEGIEVILNLRATFPELPILAISGGGRTDRGDVLYLAKQLGANAILPKPFTRAALLAAVDAHIGPGAAAAS
ncbi:MAG: response regulator [Proteobacteria bacterium]|nr:response regulator [Pseudomonadota bacterium]